MFHVCVKDQSSKTALIFALKGQTCEVLKSLPTGWWKTPIVEWYTRQDKWSSNSSFTWFSWSPLSLEEFWSNNTKPVSYTKTKPPVRFVMWSIQIWKFLMIIEVSNLILNTKFNWEKKTRFIQPLSRMDWNNAYQIIATFCKVSFQDFLGSQTSRVQFGQYYSLFEAVLLMTEV